MSSLQEEYTSILTCGKAELEEFYGRELIPADRDLVEQGADEILDGADKDDVAFLVNSRKGLSILGEFFGSEENWYTWQLTC